MRRTETSEPKPSAVPLRVGSGDGVSSRRDVHPLPEGESKRPGATGLATEGTGGTPQFVNPLSREAWSKGYEAGIAGYRVRKPHDVPHSHPMGHTPAGKNWFLGCLAALEWCDGQFKGDRKEKP